MMKILGSREEGFTIIEVALVCVILGVLSALAIPFFGSQRESAIEATLVSDVRNAAMEMEKQAIFSEDGYAPQIPDTFFPSSGNMIVIDESSSSEHAYCVIGSTPEYEDMFFYYHSDHRVVTKDMKTCGFTPMEEMPPYEEPESEEPHDHEPPTATAPDNTQTTPKPNPTGEVTAQPSSDPNSTTPPTATAPDSTQTTPTPTPKPKPVKPRAPAPEGYDDPKKQKYKICHNNGQALELPLPAIINGHAGHHDGHDIIPYIPGKFAGQNWTIQGADIWKKDCLGMTSIDYM